MTVIYDSSITWKEFISLLEDSIQESRVEQREIEFNWLLLDEDQTEYILQDIVIDETDNNSTNKDA